MKKYDAQQDAGGDETQTAVVSVGRFRTLAGRISAWFSQRTRRQLLNQAEAQAQSDAKALSEEHDRLEAVAKSSETKDAGAKADGSVATGAARVKVLQKMAARRNILSILDDRIGAEQQLAVIYGRWGDRWRCSTGWRPPDTAVGGMDCGDCAADAAGVAGACRRCWTD